MQDFELADKHIFKAQNHIQNNSFQEAENEFDACLSALNSVRIDIYLNYISEICTILSTYQIESAFKYYKIGFFKAYERGGGLYGQNLNTIMSEMYETAKRENQIIKGLSHFKEIITELETRKPSNWDIGWVILSIYKSYKAIKKPEHGISYLQGLLTKMTKQPRLYNAIYEVSFYLTKLYLFVDRGFEGLAYLINITNTMLKKELIHRLAFDLSRCVYTIYHNLFTSKNCFPAINKQIKQIKQDKGIELLERTDFVMKVYRLDCMQRTVLKTLIQCNKQIKDSGYRNKNEEKIKIVNNNIKLVHEIYSIL